MKTIAIAFCSVLCANVLYAGTPGNHDMSIVYAMVLAAVLLMLGTERLIKWYKHRKAAHANILQVHDSESGHSCQL